MKFRRDPSLILKSVGIYSPQNIDLDVVACALGASVKRKSLKDCEGYIIGTSDRAIITINSDASQERQKFSLGHELGHWVNDKSINLTYKCTSSDMKQFKSRPNDLRQQKEVRANKFSAELIFPKHIATPILKELDLTFESAKHIANLFSASITSSAIRLVEISDFPGMLICWDKTGRRKWFIENEGVTEGLWPHKNVSSLLLSKLEKKPTQVDMDLWFDQRGAEEHAVTQSVFCNSYEFFTLLWWKDESYFLNSSDLN